MPVMCDSLAWCCANGVSVMWTHCWLSRSYCDSLGFIEGVNLLQGKWPQNIEVNRINAKRSLVPWLLIPAVDSKVIQWITLMHNKSYHHLLISVEYTCIIKLYQFCGIQDVCKMKIKKKIKSKKTKAKKKKKKPNKQKKKTNIHVCIVCKMKKK